MFVLGCCYFFCLLLFFCVFRSFWLLLINCYFYDFMENVNAAAETSLLSMCSHHVFHVLQWNSYQFEILWRFDYETANHVTVLCDLEWQTFSRRNEIAMRTKEIIVFAFHCTCACTWNPFKYLFHEVVKCGSVAKCSYFLFCLLLFYKHSHFYRVMTFTHFNRCMIPLYGQ